MKNLDRIIFSHLNINSIRNKLETLHDIVKNKIDILLLSETKIGSIFPETQFLLNGFSTPFRLDRTANGGGLLLYVRHDIPCKLLNLNSEIECIVTEVTIGKKKMLLLGTYNSSKTLIVKNLLTLGNILIKYFPSYDNFVILRNFNCEIKESHFLDFCDSFDIKNLIKMPICYKSKTNPSCIYLILTYKSACFQNS